MEEVKYINISSMDDPKYTNCHMEYPSIKHHYTSPNPSSAGAAGGGTVVNTTNGAVPPNATANNGNGMTSNCPADESDNITLIKGDDNQHNYSMPLPSFLH